MEGGSQEPLKGEARLPEEVWGVVGGKEENIDSVQTLLDFTLAAVTNSTPSDGNFLGLRIEVLHPGNPWLRVNWDSWLPCWHWTSSHVLPAALVCPSCSWSPRVTSGNPHHESPPASALPGLTLIPGRPALVNL